jgi:WD40 repeat protein
MRALAPMSLALVLCACSEGPPPVNATRVLEVAGIRPVVNAVALSPDGGLVAVGDLDGDVVAREVPSGAERWTARARPRRGGARIDGVAFSPDGALVVTTGHEARTTELWDAATGRLRRVVEVGRGRGVAFHPSERLLAMAAAGAIHVIDLDRGEATRSLPNAHAGDPVYAVAFAPDGQMLASISHGGSLKIWAWPSLVLRASIALSSEAEALSPVSLTLSRDSSRAAANGIRGRLHVVDIVKAREAQVFGNVPEGPGHARHAELRQSLAFTDDGDWLFAPDSHDRGLRLLHLPSGKAYPVLRGEGRFYKAVALNVPAGLVALLRPGDPQGHGPYGLEVWRLTYRAR